MRLRLPTSRHFTPMMLSGAMVVACAQGESLSEPTVIEGGSSGTGTVAGSAESGGSKAGAGGVPPNAGTGGSLGTSGSGGSAGLAGTGAGGAAGTAGTGGTGGSGGGGSGGASGGGGASGSGGKAGGGGTGGAPPVGCAVAIPNKNNWVATASDSSLMCPSTMGLCNPPENAVDDDNATRWSTGLGQAEGMWLQIDFGGNASISEVTLYIDKDTEITDQPEGYEVIVSGTNNNINGTPVTSGSATDGQTYTVGFTATTGRYLLIQLTEDYVDSWWTVYELDVACD